MNFVFISPNFPNNYWNFCRGLKENGVNVLGIGDEEYDNLDLNLKNSLNEYYKVSSLENYDEVYRACAYFTFKYGRIDWLESNNEYWLIKDAKLRTDFNISTGIKSDKVSSIRYKSKMKEFYNKAGVKTARFHLVTGNYEDGKKFINEVGYPVVVKPDNGIGAAATYKLSNDEELGYFYDSYDRNYPYIMEEFINGELMSYDGIADKNKEIIFETAHLYTVPIMDAVNEVKDIKFYSFREIPENLKEAGRKTVKAFDTNSRFFHCEFFRLLEDKKGLGNKGDIVGLEVNMRPPGGHIPDMMNFANNIDVYKIWADMVVYNKGNFDKNNRPYHSVFVARRDSHNYIYSQEEVIKKYENNIVIVERIPEIMAAAMGNDMMIARFSTLDECNEFSDMYLKKY